MKTEFKLSLLMIAIIISGIANTQNRYLKITLSEDTSDNVSFPPGTKFELKNGDNELVYSNEDSTNEFIITEAHKLIVYPNWKETTDVFHISNGKVERIDTRLFEIRSTAKKEKRKSKTYVHNHDKYTNGLSMKKTLKRSEVNPELYNATFEFSNGIIATYKDGEFKAKLNGDDLIVGYKYFIYSDSGIIKLSFRPSNGETWWVFQPAKD
ncbi:hypothetical protein [Winogradskyella sp.]|uniref:hypothetical protein n=1 Tax=Winogradskyella sp. TaxID=1883156 RepID=UPI0026168A6A|nr:hypothetical protein [Winogradskyella sp.]